MTDLITAEEAQKLLEHCEMLIENGWEPDPENFPTEAAPDLARTVIALHAELAQARPPRPRPMSEQKQAMPPERIWVFGRQHTRNKALGKAFRGDEYILATDPAVKALVAEAVAEERERCVMAARLAMVNIPQADEFTCSICAAAIRKGETP